MLLLSVDTSYGRAADRAEREVRDTLSQHHVEWRSVVEPDGWTGVGRRFNAFGYGLILVDPHGIVRGVDLRAPQISPLLAAIYPKGNP